MKDVLIIGVAAVAVYAVWRMSQPAKSGAPATPATSGSSTQSLGTAAENAIQAKTGVPVAAIGNLATKAPTWLKVAVFPIGATAVAQSVITHPIDTAKKIGSAASSVYHSIGSIF